MIILTDSETLFLKKIASKKGLDISNIYNFPNDLENQSLLKSSETILILLSETFYKILISKTSKEFIIESFDNILISIKEFINNFVDKSNHIYLTFVPHHFLYGNTQNKLFFSGFDNGLYIDLANSLLFKEFSETANVTFLKGLVNIKLNLSKDYFRFSSIYNIDNSEEIFSQFLESEKYKTSKKKKLIIMDLDNTLWKGIIGEDSIDGIRLDLSDPLGAVYNHVQRIFINFKKQGFLLAICSKNEEKQALNALFNHPSTVFREDDIVSHRINWDHKSKNILEICKELNISPKETIFVDDSEYECDEVLNNVPEISIFKVPKNIYSYPYLILNDPLFIYDPLTKEDKNRTLLYQDRIKRNKLLEKTIEESGTKEEWIKSLDTNLNIYQINPESKQLSRIIQLFNRTNQFNITGNKYSHSTLIKQINDPNKIYYFGNSFDRIGSEGIVSVLGFHRENKTMIVEEFILSCRVFNRYIEESMLKPLLEIAMKFSCSIKFKFNDTGRNKVAQEFISSNIINKGYIPLSELSKTYKEIINRPINVINNINNEELKFR